ncbi:hypothetical protein RDI58_020972 [Solanum bulbocastanum]
MFLTLAR